MVSNGKLWAQGGMAWGEVNSKALDTYNFATGEAYNILADYQDGPTSRGQPSYFTYGDSLYIYGGEGRSEQKILDMGSLTP